MEGGNTLWTSFPGLWPEESFSCQRLFGEDSSRSSLWSRLQEKRGVQCGAVQCHWYICISFLFLCFYMFIDLLLLLLCISILNHWRKHYSYTSYFSLCLHNVSIPFSRSVGVVTWLTRIPHIADNQRWQRVSQRRCEKKKVRDRGKKNRQGNGWCKRYFVLQARMVLQHEVEVKVTWVQGTCCLRRMYTWSLFSRSLVFQLFFRVFLWSPNAAG